MAQYSRKLANGTFWSFKFDFKGNTYRSKSEYPSKQEAKIAEAECLSQIKRESGVIKNDKILLITVIEERLKYLNLHSSKKYYLDTARYLKIFYSHFGECFITDISKLEIQDFIMKFAALLKKNGKKNHTINSAIRCYKAFYNFASERYEINLPNPFIKLKFFPIEKKVKYIPSDQEIEALLSVCNPDQALLVRFVMETGARISEALNFTFGDVYDNYIVLYTCKSRNSNRTPRKLPLPDCLKDLNKLKPDEKVFGSWSGRPKFLEKKLRKLDYSVWGFHNLRHRYASTLSKAGVPIFEIMSKLGHSNIETSQRYLQLL